MKLADFIVALEKAVSKYSLKLRVLIKTDNAVKARIDISDNIYVQFYFHQISGTSKYVLVGWNNRLYGRDCVCGNWHRHPFENPEHMRQLAMALKMRHRRCSLMKCLKYC